MLIEMDGEQGTQIRDKTPTNAANNGYQNRRSITVTLYESTVNVLHIQLDCAQQYRDDSLTYSCILAYHIDVWIDLNDDGKFGEVENRVLHRSLIHSQGLRGTYDLEICIPQIDDINTKTGLHRMRLSLMPNEDYQKKCSKTDYSEKREYTVNIVPKPTCRGKIYLLIPFVRKSLYACLSVHPIRKQHHFTKEK
jgi:hypothetical protein